MHINFKNKHFLQYQLHLFKEKQISYGARELYSFIYTYCTFYSTHGKDGWCGLSNEHLCEQLALKLPTLKRYLKELKDVKMIVVKNPGRRTKAHGESRQIYINAENYITEDEGEIKKSSDELLKIIQKQKDEMDILRMEIATLRSERSQMMHITELGKYLINTGLMKESQYLEQAEELNHLLQDFERWHRQGRRLTQKCFDYWYAHRATEIKNPVRYILSCIDSSKEWINMRNVYEPDGYDERLRDETKKWREGK